MKQAECLLGGKGYVCINTQLCPEGQSCPYSSLNNLYGGISSRFPLVNHLSLPGSESIFGLSQGPPMCACTSLSQDGF